MKEQKIVTFDHHAFGCHKGREIDYLKDYIADGWLVKQISSSISPTTSSHIFITVLFEREAQSNQ